MYNLKNIFNLLLYRLFPGHKKGHGIHAPFVYELITKILQDNTEYNEYKQVERLKERLLNEERKIKVSYIGAGSKFSKKKFRKLNSITRGSSVNLKYGRLLFRLVKYFNSYKILELGTSVGISTSYIASANNKSEIFTIEADKNIIDIATTNFKVQGIENIQTINNTFDNCLEDILSKMKTVDFAFIDGDHRREALLKNFNAVKKYINNNSVIVIDDIRWSKEMEKAWETIKKDDLITVTIDLFFLGIIFFRKESEKQNFKIKF